VPFNGRLGTRPVPSFSRLPSCSRSGLFRNPHVPVISSPIPPPVFTDDLDFSLRNEMRGMC
jgi:hypothetical protein